MVQKLFHAHFAQVTAWCMFQSLVLFAAGQEVFKNPPHRPTTTRPAGGTKNEKQQAQVVRRTGAPNDTSPNMPSQSLSLKRSHTDQVTAH
eukprot:2838644-Amphidinium_carterae.1